MIGLGHGWPGWARSVPGTIAQLAVGVGAVWAVPFLVPAFRIEGSPAQRVAGAAVAVAGDILGLWALSWLSRWLEVTLFVAGFWTFVWAALIVDVVYAPVWLTRTVLAERAVHEWEEEFW